MAQSPPRQVGKYEIVTVLGKGAMGVVYRAVDPSLGRQVAIKTMSNDSFEDNELRLRFLREARSAGQLQHPNIVTVHELIEENDTAYIVMELLEGASLYALIRKRIQLDIAEKLSILIQVASGLRQAHEYGIVHRDLKPSNVFVLRSGVVKILDFGVAKFGESELTRAGTVFGTVEYMAPEQVQGKLVDNRADLFSLGVVAYELLSGRNPFRAETLAASVFKILSDNPESLVARVADLSPAIEAILFRALAKNTDQRFQTASEMGAALRTAAMDDGIEPRNPRLPDEVIDSAKREAVLGHSQAPRVSQWSNVAAAAGHLEQIYQNGIECFASQDFQGCIQRMSEVLDAVPVHSMALHYLSQCEEKLRKQKLDAPRHSQAAGFLASMRKAHRQGEAERVIDEANKLLAIDPESLEARWYRRNAETRLTPSFHGRVPSAASASRPSIGSFATGDPDRAGVKPTLVFPSPMSGSSQSRSGGVWVLGGAGVLFTALVALVWGFGGGRETPPPGENTSPPRPSHVRPSPFENEEVVVVHIPSKQSARVVPTVNSVLPKELVSGHATTIRLFGSNFLPGAQIVSASGAGDVEVVSVKVLSEALIEVTLRTPPGLETGEVSLFVENPNKERSPRQDLRIVPREPAPDSPNPQ